MNIYFEFLVHILSVILSITKVINKTLFKISVDD